MDGLSAFIKNNVAWVICTAGLAVLGYLGYYSVRWIINKCQATEKIDLVAGKCLDIISEASNSAPAPSLVNRVSDLEISPDKINVGQGEYIVFRELTNGEKEGLTEDEYQQVYPVLKACSPAALIKSESADAPTEGAGRYDLIKNRLQLIDPALRAVFVPKTLYELFYIRESIQEDVSNNAICPIVVDSIHSKLHAELRQEWQTRKCWHFIPCMSPEENDDDGVQYIAYRLNEAMRESFDPSVEGFTHQELSAFVEKEIQFLKEHHKSSKVASNAYSEARARDEKQKVVPEALCNCTTPGPTSNFGFESVRGNIMPMGIRYEADAQIIRNALLWSAAKSLRKPFCFIEVRIFRRIQCAGQTTNPTVSLMEAACSLDACTMLEHRHFILCATSKILMRFQSDTIN